MKTPLQRLLLVPLIGLALACPARAQWTDVHMPGANTNTPAALHHGAIALGSWNTTVEYKDIVVTSNDVVLYRSDFAKNGKAGWNIVRGNWSVKDGVLQETAIDAQCRAIVGDTNWANYTLTLRARKTGGVEGFVVYFNLLDNQNWTYFNVGGWTNSAAGIQFQTNGNAWAFLSDRVHFTVESNVWYDVRVVLSGNKIACYVNSNLIQTATYSNPPPVNVPAPVAAAPRKDFLRFNPSFHGAIGVGSWDTVAEFRNIVVTSNGVTLYKSDFDKDSIDDWQILGGNWAITNGVLRQDKVDFNCFATIGDTNWSDYTLTLQARKISGDEGFCALVGRSDGGQVWFNVGSWGNHNAEIYQDTTGRRGPLTGMVPLSVESGRWYDVKMVVKGAEVSCYLDSNLIQTATANVLVTTNAVYLGSQPMPDGNDLIFQLGKNRFSGRLSKDRGGPPALEPGSLVQVTGTVQPGTDSDFQIWSPVDVVLLERPSWWTWERILWFGGTSLAALAIATTWIAMISRKNRLLTIAQGELQKANDELENRVQKRTAALAKANGELKHEQALLRTLLDNASDYIYFKDMDSRFVHCSISTSNRCGLTHEQLVGKTDFDIFRDEHAHQAFNDEQEIIRTGQPLLGKLEREVHADGRVTWVLTTKMPWRNPDGQIIGTFGISCDITSIKKAEAELARAHEQLVDASRAAGMAEVATGVLHNVGNVLNSVNVSTAVLSDRMKNSKVKSVGQVAALMSEHAAELGDFIAKDPRGQRLPQFLRDLSAQLELEQARALEELAGLRKNVGHIKDIVAMQQNYASVAGVNAIVNISELLDDVLRLTEASLTRHGVQLVKEFDANLPSLNIDRHKVLQILVNLVRNARQACDDAEQSDKQMTLRATANNGCISISVTDNGVGIPAENLTRIFAHGFTTRKGGHGFGLHSSALAAKEIGGRLSVQSGGPGNGATFTLELNSDPGATQSPPKSS